MKKHLWYIRGFAGEYGDYHEWPVAIVGNPMAAYQIVRRLEKAYKAKDLNKMALLDPNTAESMKREFGHLDTTWDYEAVPCPDERVVVLGTSSPSHTKKGVRGK